MTTSGGDNRSSSLRRAASQPFLDGMEARFMERCEVGLQLSETMLQRAVCFFKDSKLLLLANIDSIGSGTVEEAERLWNACVFYAVKRLSSATCVGEGAVEGTAAGFTLMQLLQVTNISVMDLFKELPQFLVKAAPTLQALYGDSWEKLLQVKEVQANFVHMKVLSK
jgi:retinoblastoma-like protein 1